MSAASISSTFSACCGPPAGDGGGLRAGSQSNRPAAGLHARSGRVGCDRRCTGDSACADWRRAPEAFLPEDLNFRGSLHVDWMGAAFALLLAVIATLLAGAAPAWMSWRTQPQEALRGDSRSASESRGGKQLRVFRRCRSRCQRDPGPDDGVVDCQPLPPDARRARLSVGSRVDSDHRIAGQRVSQSRRPLQENAGQAAATALGVENAAIVSILPLDGDYWIDMALLPGDTRSVFQMPTEHWRWISPEAIFRRFIFPW